MARHFITQLDTATREAGRAAVGELVFDTDRQEYFQGNSSTGNGNWSAIKADAAVQAYDGGTTYNINQLVRSGSDFYVSLMNNNNSALTVTTHWMRLGNDISDPGNSSYTRIQSADSSINGFDVDDSTQQFYNTSEGRHALDLVMQNSTEQGRFSVGDRIVVTGITVATGADVNSSNILWSGTVSRSDANNEFLGAVVNIDIDAGASRTYFTTGSPPPASATTGQVTDTTIEDNWRVWRSAVDRSGVVVSDENADYSVESFNEFFDTHGPISSGTELPQETVGHVSLFILTQNWVNAGITYQAGLYRRVANSGNISDWHHVGFNTGDTLPTTTGTAGELFLLVRVSGSNTPGLYERIAPTATWRRLTRRLQVNSDDIPENIVNFMTATGRGGVTFTEAAGVVSGSVSISGQSSPFDITSTANETIDSAITLSTEGTEILTWTPNDHFTVRVPTTNNNSIGDTVILRENDTPNQMLTTRIVSITNFGTFLEFFCHPLDDTQQMRVEAIADDTRGVTIEGDERTFAPGTGANQWQVYTALNEPEITVGDRVFFDNLSRGTTLPDAGFANGDIRFLTQQIPGPPARPAGLYLRLANTWRQISLV